MQLFIYRTAPFGQTRAGCRQNDFKCRHNAHMALSIDNRGYERGHESKKSMEVYQHLSLGAVEQAYQEAVQGVSI